MVVADAGGGGRLALLAGHSILGHEPRAELRRTSVETAWGEVEALEGDGWVLVQRHGLGTYRTAARIEHRANLSAVAALGCDRVLAIGSVGSLRAELAVGSFVCPDDFVALQLGLSLHEGHGGERVPGFDRVWRGRMLDAWSRCCEWELHDGGTYWQAIGPRFETPAEIALIAPHADVIGMTIASECILAGELGLPYAAICSVDNLANGLGADGLDVADFEAGKAASRERLLAALEPLARELGGGVRG